MDREAFRTAVFMRDNNCCVECGDPAVDAHHILERRLWSDGGYILDNGISLCEKCHLLAEQTILTPEHLRQKAGIRRIVMPAQMYSDEQYDKWGNIILSDGRRLPGPLFDDPSVQKVLRIGNVLSLFVKYSKHPRMLHLPWSYPHKDDSFIETLLGFGRQEVVVTEKLDGENITMYNDYIHARSVDSESHPSRGWVKNFWAQRAYNIPESMRVCGENMYAIHSIRYTDLSSYFYGFSVWDKDTCLSWDDTIEWLQLLDIQPVPVLYRGIWDEYTIKNLRLDETRQEGYVVRVTDEIPMTQFKELVAKYVRPGHIQTPDRWKTHWKPNTLKLG